jgi:predicted permease
LFSPAFIFYNLYIAELSLNLIKILYFAIAFMILNDILARVISKVRKYDSGMRNAFKNAIMFNNSGNIGISLITLVFGNAPYIVDGGTPYLNQALTAQVIVLVFMNITMNTIGFFNAGRAKMDIKNSIFKIFAMRIVYFMPMAFILDYFRIDITWTPVWPAIVFIKNGLVPIALITLGVQLSKNEFNMKNIDVQIAVFTRLIAGPALAILGIHIFGFTGILAQTLLISYSVPTAVTIALIAAEYDNHPGFSSQEVMLSTIASAFTLTFFIYLAGILFPI